MIHSHEHQPRQVNATTYGNTLSESQSSFKQVRAKRYTQNNSQFVGFKLLAGFSSVVVSQFLIANTLAKSIFRNIYDKRYKATLLKPEAVEKKNWVDKQIKNLMKTTIRYNTLIFCSKVLLDQHYAQTFKRNQTYYESNSSLHYKIGALIGLIGYATSIPLSEFESVKAMNKIQTNFIIDKAEPRTYGERLKNVWGQFLSAQSFRRMLNSFKFMSLAGVMVYRTIYFGGYEKFKSKYEHPLNEYLLAPIGCSTLGLIVSPIDQIKYLQLTTHKGKSFWQILNEKGAKLWNLPGQKIYTSIIKQSFAMSTFVAGQNLCNYFIGLKKSFQ